MDGVDTPLSPAEKLRIALRLHEEGVELMRQNLRRAHPDADEQTIDRLIAEWLSTRPGAEHGDGPGRLRPIEDPAA